jgi:hypothetical protein
LERGGILGMEFVESLLLSLAWNIHRRSAAAHKKDTPSWLAVNRFEKLTW